MALLLKLIAGGIVGALVGCVIAPLLPKQQLRFALSCWLLFIGADFCIRAAAF